MTEGIRGSDPSQVPDGLTIAKRPVVQAVDKTAVAPAIDPWQGPVDRMRAHLGPQPKQQIQTSVAFVGPQTHRDLLEHAAMAGTMGHAGGGCTPDPGKEVTVTKSGRGFEIAIVAGGFATTSSRVTISNQDLETGDLSGEQRKALDDVKQAMDKATFHGALPPMQHHPDPLHRSPAEMLDILKHREPKDW